MKRILLIVSAALFTISASARSITDLCGTWETKPIANNQQNQEYHPVRIPSTWNAEYIPGGTEYNRETMVFRRKFTLGGLSGKREFLYFDGVNSYCDVFVNHQFAGSHKGGYTAFCLEVTKLVHSGENDLELWVSNAYRSDIPPLIGDFIVYGGIHRPCRLIETGEECIRPDFYASPGVFVDQKSVSAEKTEITVRTLVSAETYAGLEIRTTVISPEGRTVAAKTVAASSESIADFSLENLRLWNGKEDPALYSIRCELMKGGAVIDSKEVTTGFRTLAADTEKGILLNGKPYPVHGFAKHEDYAGRGNAMREEDYRTDVGLMMEAGATAVRLAHYPHAETMYDLTDRNGLLVWTEIPMCGPGGWQFAGYIGSEDFKNTTRENLKELVYQKYNHPSICFWGIFNEILYSDGGRFIDYGSPVDFVGELNSLYKSLDPSRLTTFATCEDETPFLGKSDLVAWNRYHGWYEPMEGAETFFDKVIANSRPYPVGISEYGAGASIHHHSEGITAGSKVPALFHPEEKQNAVHEENWAIFKARPVWGTFIWNLCDFKSARRNEGDTPGINDKGLVTYDRKVKKDAYYFYKAEWTSEPMVYITSRRFTERESAITDIKVYTNCKSAVLYINGKKISEGKKDSLSRIVWKDIRLEKGENVIRVVSGKGRKAIEDSCTWTLR